MNRLYFDSEEDQWRLQSILPERSAAHTFCYIKYFIIYIYIKLRTGETTLGGVLRLTGFRF